MCANDRLISFAALVRKEEARARMLLRCYPEVLKYLVKKYAIYQAIEKNDISILRYEKLSSMTPRHYADNLIAISCQVPDEYYRSTLSDVFIKGVDGSIRHSLRNCLATNSEADLTCIALQIESLLSIQEESRKTPISNQLKEDQPNKAVCPKSMQWSRRHDKRE